MDERRETHDFMNVNVESFSQLPFIRRTPPTSSKEKASIIRLFGQELVGDNNNNSDNNNDSSSSETTTTTKNNVDESSDQNVKNEKDKEKEKESSNNNRRFECHYCFRNFPTSQALGGHQNAHKRERQHAKRGSMTSSYFHHQPHDHVYGFLNNHHHRHYPSWTSESRFYGGGGSGGAQQQQHQTSSYYSRTLPPPTYPTPPTINGSPLGLWRVPPSTSATAVQNVYSSAPTSAFRSTSEQETNWPYRLMKPNVQDHVSLDLHL